MGTQVNFILKVLILSVGVSVLIKYGGPSLPIAPTSLNALIAVVTPTIVLAIALWWRGEGRGAGGDKGDIPNS